MERTNGENKMNTLYLTISQLAANISQTALMTQILPCSIIVAIVYAMTVCNILDAEEGS